MTPSPTTPQGAEPREDGWIDFVVGSPCPVLLQDRVEVRLRNGQGRLDQAGALRWSARDDTDGHDIIAYRVVSPAPAAPTNGGGGVVAEAVRALLHSATGVAVQPGLEIEALSRYMSALQPQPAQQGGADGLLIAVEAMRDKGAICRNNAESGNQDDRDAWRGMSEWLFRQANTLAALKAEKA